MEELNNLADCLEATSKAVRQLATRLQADQAPAPKEVKVTYDEVREVLAKLTLAGRKDDVKRIVNHYGPKLSQVNESHYADILKEVEELNNG